MNMAIAIARGDYGGDLGYDIMTLSRIFLIFALCLTSATSSALSRRKPTFEQIDAMRAGESQLQKSIQNYGSGSRQAIRAAQNLSNQYLQLSRHAEAAWALEAAGDFFNGQKLMSEVEQHLQNLPIVNLAIAEPTASRGREGFIADLHTVFVKQDLPNQISDIRVERWAYLLDRLLGLNVVPPTVIRMIDGKLSSVQYWIHNGNMTSLDFRNGGYHRAPAELYLLDFLIMNADRHAANSLHRFGQKWVAIDNAHGLSGLLETEKDKYRHNLLMARLPDQLLHFDSNINLPESLYQRLQVLTKERFDAELAEIPEAARRHYWSRIEQIQVAMKPTPKDCGGWLQRLLRLF